MKNFTPTLSTSGEGEKIDVSNFPNGVYYCVLNLGEIK